MRGNLIKRENAEKEEGEPLDEIRESTSEYGKREELFDNRIINLDFGIAQWQMKRQRRICLKILSNWLRVYVMIHIQSFCFYLGSNANLLHQKEISQSFHRVACPNEIICLYLIMYSMWTRENS